jgi:hypothetical protein
MSSNKRTILLAALAFAAAIAGPQHDHPAPMQERLSVYEVAHDPGWPHIGSPPLADALPSTAKAWIPARNRLESALAGLSQSWSGIIPARIADLNFQVKQYEDFVLATTTGGGYGNLVLADTARRLDLALLLYYALIHPLDYAEVATVLKEGRVRLLDCPATAAMIAEELGIQPPVAKWRLSSGMTDLDSILRRNGSSISQEIGRTLLPFDGPTKMIEHRNVNLLLMRLTVDEEEEVSTLACILEFLRRGGDPSDPRSFTKVMDLRRDRFPFAPTGVTAPWAQASALMRQVEAWDRAPIAFSSVVGEGANASH